MDSPVQGPGDDEDLMLSLMAGQAAVDVGLEGYRIMSWEEVEDSKKVRPSARACARSGFELTCSRVRSQELSLLTNRLGSLSARCQREQKILTAARTLDRLHVNHKRSVGRWTVLGSVSEADATGPARLMRRMSKQTMEELSVAEKRAVSAEKVSGLPGCLSPLRIVTDALLFSLAGHVGRR